MPISDRKTSDKELVGLIVPRRESRGAMNFLQSIEWRTNGVFENEVSNIVRINQQTQFHRSRSEILRPDYSDAFPYESFPTIFRRNRREMLDRPAYSFPVDILRPIISCHGLASGTPHLWLRRSRSHDVRFFHIKNTPAGQTGHCRGHLSVTRDSTHPRVK